MVGGKAALITVVKQVDDKKQIAKAVAAEAENAQVSDEFKASVAKKPPLI